METIESSTRDSPSLDRVDTSIISEDGSNHVITSSLSVVDIVAFISFASLGYPQNAIFRFTGYKGLEDQDKLTKAIKLDALNSGTTLSIYIYSSHTRESK